MTHDPLLARAREVWLKMAGDPMAFPAGTERGQSGYLVVVNQQRLADSR
ncbi:hypothetical protein [Micromonospora aurantiaca (nom. illeg.)]|nr:hypothetical protein [Micromonospora aurantiaca]MBC9007058.1 hypothetical protein [Micromonospora aurantiaca]